MSDISRPEPANSVWERVRRRIETALDRLRLQRQLTPQRATSNSGAGDLDMSIAAPGSVRSLVPGVLAGVGCVLLGLGGVWAWQSWANRSSEPIDDRLPMLVTQDQPNVVTPSDPALAQPTSQGTDPAANLGSGAVETTAQADPVAAGQSAIVEPVRLVVHVAGAVTNPGVVELAAGARVIDALRTAGGATAQADLDRVNLAARVSDGERIHVPAIGEEVLPAVVPSSGRAPPAGTSGQIDAPVMLDINTATAQSLEELPGVGPSTAAAIVRTRENRGPFLSVQELLEVPGIGETKLSQIEPFVLVRR